MDARRLQLMIVGSAMDMATTKNVKDVIVELVNIANDPTFTGDDATRAAHQVCALIAHHQLKFIHPTELGYADDVAQTIARRPQSSFQHWDWSAHRARFSYVAVMTQDTYVVIGRDGRYLASGCQTWTMQARRVRRFRTREQAEAQAQRFYGARVELTERAND